MEPLIEKAKYQIKIIFWMLNGYLGRDVTIEPPKRLTVLITYFNPVRMKKINHQIRNVLKCSFVERLIISNHNPDVDIHNKIKIRDRRLVVINQTVKRGCGFRWLVASQFDMDYLVVIDDDILMLPGQLKNLFKCLLAEPHIPHGLSGMNSLPNGGFEFRDRETRDVDFLCEVYALTRHQLNRYLEINAQVSLDEQIARIVDSVADFMIVSQTGASRPKIHDLGRLFRDETFKMEGVAVHKDLMFDEHMLQVRIALQNLQLIDQAF